MLGFTITRKKKDEEDRLDIKGEEKKTTRNKKKEPPKPWGRAERLIVFGLLFATVLGSSVLALSARSWKLSGLSLKLLPSLSLHKTYVLEKPTNEDFSIPVAEFKDLVRSKSGVYSFFVTRIYRDSSYGLEQYNEIESESLSQLILLWQIYSASSKGELSLSKSYVIKRDDKVGETGLKLYSTGSTLSYRELAGMLCAKPDLAVEKIFLDALGNEAMQSSLQKNLSLSTNFEKHTTTAADIGYMLKRIVESDALDSASQEEFVDCLRKADSGEFTGIFDSQFVYKYNLDSRQASVAGMVFSPKPYVVVVVGEGTVESEAREVLLQALQIIADFES